MRVIVLGAWANNRIFVVVVILVAEIPVQSPIDPEGQPHLRRLKTHRVGRDQRSRRTGRIADAITLPAVLVETIGAKDRNAGKELRRYVAEEEIIPHEVEALPLRMIHAVEEVIDDRIAI